MEEKWLAKVRDGYRTHDVRITSPTGPCRPSDLCAVIEFDGMTDLDISHLWADLQPIQSAV
jgi:hypothetical protein